MGLNLSPVGEINQSLNSLGLNLGPLELQVKCCTTPSQFMCWKSKDLCKCVNEHEIRNRTFSTKFFIDYTIITNSSLWHVHGHLSHITYTTSLQHNIHDIPPTPDRFYDKSTILTICIIQTRIVLRKHNHFFPF